MQGEQLTSFESSLLVLFSALSLFGMKFLHSSRSAIRFRCAQVSEPPLWGGMPVFLALLSFLIIPGLIMFFFEEALDIGLYSTEEYLSASSVTGGFLVGGGWIVYSIWWFVVVRLNQPAATLGLCRAPLENLISLLLFYVFFFPPFFLLSSLWINFLELLGHESMPQEVVQDLQEAFARGSLLEISLMVFNAVVLAPLVEEMIFRGFFFGLLRSRWGVFPALVFSSAVFAAFHFSLDALLPLFAVGLALGYVYHKTRSLYFAIFFHALFNGVMVLIQWYSAGS